MAEGQGSGAARSEAWSKEDAVDFFSRSVEASRAFVTRVDAHNRIRYVDRVADGLRMSEVVGADVLDFVAPGYREIARRAFAEVRRTGETSTYRSQAIGSHASLAYYDNIVTPLVEPDGSVGLSIFSLDVTALVIHAQALETSQAKLAVAVESAQMGLAEWDLETKEMTWNDRMGVILGEDRPLSPEEYLGRVVHPDDADFLRQRLANMTMGPLEPVEYRVIRRDGDVRWIRSTGQVQGRDGRPARMLIAVVDLTPTRNAYEQARRAQKLEAVGTLTAGVAHNFNNLLTVILPTLEELEPRLDDEGRLLLAEAKSAGHRARELVRQLMAFSGHAPSATHEVLALDGLLTEAVRLCERTFGWVRFETCIDPELRVMGSSSDLQQLFLNLLINACDALETHRGGRVEVRAALVLGKVRVEVHDDGHGMSDEVASRIFEPFFTTKGSKGTGLGLSTCQGIIEEHGGAISCRSAPQRGSTFVVELQSAR